MTRWKIMNLSWSCADSTNVSLCFLQDETKMRAGPRAENSLNCSCSWKYAWYAWSCFQDGCCCFRDLALDSSWRAKAWPSHQLRLWLPAGCLFLAASESPFERLPPIVSIRTRARSAWHCWVARQAIGQQWPCSGKTKPPLWFPHNQASSQMTKSIPFLRARRAPLQAWASIVNLLGIIVKSLLVYLMCIRCCSSSRNSTSVPSN